MREPREPEYTCPEIDQIIKEGESIDSIVASINSEIEDLREANEELRDWGHYWKDKYEELEKEVNQ